MIYLTRILSPFGPLMAAASDTGICLLEFGDRRMLETQFERLKKYFQAEITPGEHPYLETLNRQLEEYFLGQRQKFNVPLDFRGTVFQEMVWKALLTIPYGKTISYKQLAEKIGKPAAVRAVANANGDNRIAILIPCHRVIGSDGTLTGYGGGLWRKQFLLELEGAIPKQFVQPSLLS
ncbi:MAG: cysteine methyltransferase [Chloroflexi bacterium HGW-Chloroflexi-10]|nr:MAG: cysteine methyltransferase [Chloroflexi bacterium HGW-Chloroflexi-10]